MQMNKLEKSFGVLSKLVVLFASYGSCFLVEVILESLTKIYRKY